MRRAVLSWVAIGVLFSIALVLSVAALNADVYSARGFVRSYLDALARQDAAAALAMPGVQPASGPTDLLTAPAMSPIGAIALVTDIAADDGSHSITFDVALGEGAADGPGAGTARTEFHVQPSAARFGVFANWRFSTPPLATLTVSAIGADAVSVNRAQIDTSPAGAHLVFVPGLYVLDHESVWLEASEIPVRVSEPGSTPDATVDVTANAALVDAVQQDIDTTLDACAQQGVLMPTGCPFGRAVTDRVDGDVTWTIDRYPRVTLAPGERVGEWTATAAQGRAALSVPVQELFTGDESTLTDTVSISAEYGILIADSGSVTVGAAQ